MWCARVVSFSLALTPIERVASWIMALRSLQNWSNVTESFPLLTTLISQFLFV